MIFHEEYARADAPVRVNHLGEELLGPTLMAFGTEEQRARFLPKIVAVEELWAQGYSELDAGSDLANVQTKARLAGDEWVIDGQKVWTSNAHLSQWAFVLCRTEPGSVRHRGLSFLLVPLDQDGVGVRPIEQLTGGSEFNEVFLTGARTSADLVVGEPGDGWRVAMALLGFERGVSVLAQVVGFARQLEGVVDRARDNGAIDDPVLRDRLAQLKVELGAMRSQALRGLSSAAPGGDSIFKLVWSNWHKRLGEVAMDIVGAAGLTAGCAVRARPLAAAVPLLARRHDLRRQRRGPAQHPRRAGARPTPRGTRMTVPDYVPGHDLLNGKVVVTAAAGAGIGADRVRSLVCDVTDEAQVTALLDAADGLGGVDVMVNNAGLGGTANILEMTDDQWSRVLDITLTGTFRCIRAAGARMVAAGTRGVIVNNASVIGWRAQEGQAHYAAAKAGVMALTRCAALDLAPHGIRVNAVSPSRAMHAFLAKVTSDDLLAELTDREAFKRAAEPWEVANVMVFLASDYASYMTGEVVAVSSQQP
ncbi:SDR family oxidoreductase [Nocardioides pyridinolyticus]